jgi:hypothetical protein
MCFVAIKWSENDASKRMRSGSRRKCNLRDRNPPDSSIVFGPGLEVIDVADPSARLPIGRILFKDSPSCDSDLAIIGDRIVVAGGWGPPAVTDVSNPHNPKQESTLEMVAHACPRSAFRLTAIGPVT